MKTSSPVHSLLLKLSSHRSNSALRRRRMPDTNCVWFALIPWVTSFTTNVLRRLARNSSLEKRAQLGSMFLPMCFGTLYRLLDCSSVEDCGIIVDWIDWAWDVCSWYPELWHKYRVYVLRLGEGFSASLSSRNRLRSKIKTVQWFEGILQTVRERLFSA